MTTNKIYGEKALLRKVIQVGGFSCCELAQLLATSKIPNLADEGFTAPFTLIPIEGVMPNTYILVGHSGNQRVLSLKNPHSEDYICTLETKSENVNAPYWRDYIAKSISGCLYIQKREIFFPDAVLDLTFGNELSVIWEFRCSNAERLTISFLLPKTPEFVTETIKTSVAVFEAISSMNKIEVTSIFNYFDVSGIRSSHFVAEYSSSAGKVLHSITARNMEVVAYTKTVVSTAVYTAASLLIDSEIETSEEKEAKKAGLQKSEKVTYTVTSNAWTFESNKLTFSYDKNSGINFKTAIPEKSLKLLAETINLAKQEVAKVYQDLPVKWKS